MKILLFAILFLIAVGCVNKPVRPVKYEDLIGTWGMRHYLAVRWTFRDTNTLIIGSVLTNKADTFGYSIKTEDNQQLLLMFPALEPEAGTIIYKPIILDKDEIQLHFFNAKLYDKSREKWIDHRITGSHPTMLLRIKN